MSWVNCLHVDLKFVSSIIIILITVRVSFHFVFSFGGVLISSLWFLHSWMFCVTERSWAEITLWSSSTWLAGGFTETMYGYQQNFLFLYELHHNLITKVKVSQVQVRVGIGLGVLTKRKEQKRIIIRNVFKLIVPPKLSLLSSHETSLWKNRKQPISNCTEIVHHPG